MATHRSRPRESNTSLRNPSSCSLAHSAAVIRRSAGILLGYGRSSAVRTLSRFVRVAAKAVVFVG